MRIKRTSHRWCCITSVFLHVQNCQSNINRSFKKPITNFEHNIFIWDIRLTRNSSMWLMKKKKKWWNFFLHFLCLPNKVDRLKKLVRSTSFSLSLLFSVSFFCFQVYFFLFFFFPGSRRKNWSRWVSNFNHLRVYIQYITIYKLLTGLEKNGWADYWFSPLFIYNLN